MLETKEIITIILTSVNLIIAIIIIYSSTKINPIKNDFVPSDKNNSYPNVSYIEQQILYQDRFFLNNNSFSLNEQKIFESKKNDSASEKISNFFTKTHLSLFFTGICSCFFVIMFLISFFVKDKEYSCDCFSCTNCNCKCTKEDCCFFATYCCCCCHDCCRRRRGEKCCQSNGDNCGNCNCNSSGGGSNDDGIGYAVIIIILLFVVILIVMILYFSTKALGKSLSRIVALVFLILFDIGFFILGLFRGINDGMNTYSYLVVIFGILGFLGNLIVLIFKCLSHKGNSYYQKQILFNNPYEYPLNNSGENLNVNQNNQGYIANSDNQVVYPNNY